MDREITRKEQRRAMRRRREGEKSEGQPMDDLPESLLEEEDGKMGMTLPFLHFCLFLCTGLQLSSELKKCK